MDVLAAARKAAADQYDQAWPMRASTGSLAREGFEAGWDAAMRQVASLMATPGGDGCYCTHHPDDPAHTSDCYGLFKALTGR